MKNLGIITITLGAASFFFAGCGPDVDVQTHSTTGMGQGGTGAGGSGGGGSGGTGGSGNGLACTKLVVQPMTIAVTALAQFSPRIARDPASGQLLYVFLNGSPQDGGSLYSMTADAFDSWPPNWTPALMADMAVKSFTLGEGSKGPIGIVRHLNAGPQLIDSFLPQVKFVDMPLTDEGDPLFVTAIENRYFWGSAYDAGMYDVLHLGSYQPGSLPQSEQPLLCSTSKIRAAAQPLAGGFLAAIVEPNSPNTLCDPANPLPGTSLSLLRYDSGNELGSPLTHKTGWRFDMSEPIKNLGLARTSDGAAWVAYQTDGSTSEVAPPIMASRVMSDGYVVGDGAADQISPEGQVTSALAIAALENTLAAAWIDAIDPSAPVIQIKLHELGNPQGLQTSIPTNDAWYESDLQLVAANDKRSLLVAWKSKSITAFVRVDCVD